MNGRLASSAGLAGPVSTAVAFLGERAILAQVDDLATAHRLAAALRGAALAGVEDVVPGAGTVTVLADPLVCDLAALATALPTWELPPPAAGSARTHQIPVVYDGADLDEVGATCGLATDEVVRRHTAVTYTVAFLGFSPGFAYLVGLDPALTVPRRATPRTTVPAGSVAIADAHTAIYPQATPGGWQLVGHTDTVLFDAGADPPALLAPADRVRLVAAR